MPTLAQVRRYWHTLRYLRRRQVIARADLRGRALLRQLAPARAVSRYAARAARAGLIYEHNPWGLSGQAPRARRLLAPEALARIERDARGALAGRFTFLNESVGDGRLDWTAPGASRLWRYHLHYFDYLLDGVVAGVDWRRLEALALDWIASNPLGPLATRDGWHPYVVSVRAVNWMMALAALPDDTPPASAMVHSLASQIVFVERNLEADVGGNHLLKNLKALAIAGSFWRGAGAARLLDRFVPAFVEELARQVRSDGGHYEQSPMYHAQVLADAAEVAIVLRLRGEAVPPSLDERLSQMRAFLDRVCHPDGQIAQFGDSAFNMTPAPDEVRAAAALGRGEAISGPFASRHALAATRLQPSLERPSAEGLGVGPAPDLTAFQGPWDLQASGVVTLASRDRRFHLVADAGPVCPDDLPAHAHSDLFGFEVSVDGVRLLVDTGVSEYCAGIWRAYERSTRAHSTVAVDGREQSECWGSFRVAQRARVTAGRWFSRPGVRGASACHDGYERLAPPVRHTRQFAFLDERAWLVVDALDGRGTHRFETWLHLHPEATLVAGHDEGWLITRGPARLRVLAFGVGRPTIVRGQLDPPQGWYAPEFGRRLAAPVLSLSGQSTLPVSFGWLLAPDPVGGSADGVARVEAAADRMVRVELGGRHYEVPFVDPID